MFKPTFKPEPAFTHGQAPRTAVLLCNLGTPDEPTAAAVRRYLAEFLGDPRVVEIPRLVWMVILHGIILRVRPAKSAAKYATIWGPEGSPLKVWTNKQSTALQAAFNAQGESVTVRYAMRYGNPSIDSQLDALKAEGFTRILILPAYPQYSGTTTASVMDAVYHWGLRTRLLPEFRFINHYHDHPAYIHALAEGVRSHWAQHGQGERLVMSFHGVPERTLHLGDPYHCECYKTARLLAEALKLSKEQYMVTFQSRFGKAKWLEPYTEPSLIALAQQEIKRVDLICPGFTSDCLETLEEISQEAREAYLNAGGEVFHYIHCLNDSATWIQGLHQLCHSHLTGWPLDTPNAQQLQISQAHALELGAKK
ncbi:ferrochelatase [Limnohabitans sp. MORI2]|uniref:ferrochelatase n=1 Tax=Limnohabitans sp. MORI2 TaxID=1751150 RepID=UPI0023776475|nr:ferrochelatase [Limnohabitans sp. MORI2]BDU57946.1 ferrochelatase [Limnohabitans sp. MORI2]